MLPVRKMKQGLLFAIFIFLASLIIPSVTQAGTHKNNFVYPVIPARDGKLSGLVCITEASPGSITAGEEINFNLDARSNSIDWGIYTGENPEGIEGAWIYAPPTVGSDINTINGLEIISQSPDSVTIRVDSVQAGDRAYLGICVNGDRGSRDINIIKPGNVRMIMSSSSGTEFIKSEAVNAQNFLPEPAVQATSSAPEMSLAASGAATVNMTAYGSTGLFAWPQLSYDNSRTSTSPYASSPNFTKWAVKLDDLGGGTYDCTFREAPVIGKDNVVFITAASYSTDEFSVYAIYPDGTLKWRTVLSNIGERNYNYSSLTLSDDGCLYIGTDEWINKNSHLYCIDEETGAVNWSYSPPLGPPGDSYPGNTIYSPPIIHPDTGDIIFSTWELICLDKSGNRRWGYYDGANIYEHFAAISPYNGFIYFCDWGLTGTPRGNTRMQAVDINGNKKYSYTFPNDSYGYSPGCGDRSAPIILPNGNVLITATYDYACCLSPELVPIWTTEVTCPPWVTSITPPALSPDKTVMYVQSWSWGGLTLCAFNVETGEILWNIDFTDQLNAMLGKDDTYQQESGLTVEAGGKILVNAYSTVNNTQVLFTVNPSGQIIDAVYIQTPDGIESYTQPSIAPDGTVYLGDYYYGYVVAVGSQACATDKTTLGKRPYCLYGNGSVNLSTGNFILEQTDIAMPSIGPSLQFTRFYNSTDAYEGPQGKGWTHSYNTHLTINPDQSINVAYADGQELQFTYNGGGYDRPAGCFETLAAGPDNTYILTFKDQTKYIYNSAGQLTSITDKNSNTLTLSYANGLLTNAAEPGGRSLAFGYNEDSLLSTVTDSASRSVGYTYNNGQLEAVEDVRDNIIQYQYDAQGLTTIIDPDDITILHNDYDSCSRVTSQTDGRGNVTGFNFTQANQTTVTDAVYKNTTVEYDEKYRSTKVTYPGNVNQSFAYDDNNCCQEITDGRGNTTHYDYDDFGNLLKTTDPAGNETIMTYTGYNNLDTVTNAVNSEIDFGYDPAGNLITMEDPFGETTTYDYYNNGLLQSITTPDGTDIGSGITVCAYYQDGLLHTVTDAVYNTTTTYSYDNYGFLHTITDAANKTTTINRDAAGNITGVTDPLGNTVGFTYDWRGNVLTKTDARGIVTKYTYNNVGLLESKIDAFNILDYETVYGYNALNQLETVTDPRGYQTTYIYDDLGRLTGVTDPLGQTTGYHYDNAGNLDGVTDAYGKQVLDIGYDNRNNPVTVADALGHTTTNTFTELSSLDTSEDPMGNLTDFDYNDLNILNKTTDALSGQGKQNFDAHGNRKSMIDPNTNTTAFRFDPSNRVRSITTAVGGSTDLDYNSRNLISWKRNARGQETSYYYYDNGRLHYFTNPDGTTTYTYDANGNLLTAGDSSGTIEYRYDELNRVKEYIDASGSLIGYTYDANSNLKTITYPGGKQVRYDYTPNNQLETVTDWANRTTSYEYGANGRLTKTIRPDGSVETRDYYDNGKLKQLKDVDANNNIISQYDYTYDAAGIITDDNNYNETGPYTFNSAALTYDADNRLGTYNGQTVDYDADGNMTRGPLAGDMEKFTFDARSRLTVAGDTSYTYDAGNKRIRVSEGVHQTSYVVNPNAPLSQVLIATDEQNNKTYYVYGLGLIGQESAGGSYRSYHFDHLGSTIALTSESGIITDCFQYAPYGELVYRSGNTATPFLFNGQYGVMTDESDLYYMRARYYNPIAKRFLSPDTIIGHISNPQSQNRYTYCEGNPANYVDPTGHDLTRANFYNSEFVGLPYEDLYVAWISSDEKINNENLSQREYEDLILQNRMANAWLIIRGSYTDDNKEYAHITLAGIMKEELQKEDEKNLAIVSGFIAGKAFSSRATWSSKGGSTFQGIRATQPLIEGTNIPKSFVLRGMKVGQNELWVHPHATKHMAEFVNASANRTGHAALVEREMMASFQSAVEQAIPQLTSGRNFLAIGGWELGINAETGVIYHALMK